MPCYNPDSMWLEKSAGTTVKSLLASLVLCTLSNVALADATDGWKEQATDNENSVIYTNAEKKCFSYCNLSRH